MNSARAGYLEREGEPQVASCGREGTTIKFTGIDALPVASGGIKAVAQGSLQATLQYATGGSEAIALAKKILVDCAKDVPKSATLATGQTTKDNAAGAYTTLGGKP
jgi:ribose transport system substrate-binding protein